MFTKNYIVKRRQICLLTLVFCLIETLIIIVFDFVLCPVLIITTHLRSFFLFLMLSLSSIQYNHLCSKLFGVFLSLSLLFLLLLKVTGKETAIIIRQHEPMSSSFYWYLQIVFFWLKPCRCVSGLGFHHKQTTKIYNVM